MMLTLAAPVWIDCETGEPEVVAPVVHPLWCTDCSTDVDGSVYHGSPVSMLDLVDEGGKVTEVWISVHRLDDEDGTQSPTTVTFTLDHDGFDLAPDNVREFAALLLAAADLIEGDDAR